MRYVLGIDSGGTNYRVEAQSLDGERLGFYIGQPANHYYITRDEMTRRVNASIDACLAQFSGQRADAAAIVCGTTGLDSPEDETLLRDFYNALPGFACPIRVLNDAELAHYTVTGGTGVLVISGTGSIAFGRNKAGQTCRTGGWLFTVLGDEGSGTWVSRRALRYLGRWLDGAVPDSELTRLVRRELGITKRDDLNQLAAQCGEKPWHVPPLGKLVNAAAAAGDPAAVEILQEAAVLTADLVSDAAHALKLSETEPDFPVGAWGSNLLCSPTMLDTFRREIARRFPQAHLLLPTRTATEGAAALARESVQ